MRAARRLAAFGLALGVTSATLAAAPAAVPTLEAIPEPPAHGFIREAGRAWLADNDGVGLSIGVFDDGQRAFFNFGVSQLDGNKPPTQATVYEIGAISRIFSGQLLARAVIEGRVSLNDEVTRYLDEPYPNLARDGEPVRLLHLANATSQLLDVIPDLTQVRGVPGEPLAATRQRVFEKYTRKEFTEQLRRVAPRQPPGGMIGQSNLGTMLLGLVLEKVYGEPFEKILAREIEKPLHMGSGAAPAVKLLARGYTAANEPLPPFAAATQWPSQGLRYSTDELLRFAAWQMFERDASVKLAHRPAWTTPDGRQSVGFFWILGESDQGRRLRYSGATYGFTSHVDLYPDAKVAIVLLANKNADGAQETLRALSAKIVDALRPISPLSSADAPPQAR